MAVSKHTDSWLDTPQRYGRVTRILHWSIAVLILWQIGLVAAYKIFGERPLLETLATYTPHGIVGFLVMVIGALRLLWSLANRHRRPQHGNGLLGLAARSGHALLYALMLFIPAVALLRNYGSGRGWKPLGIEVIPATGEKVDWMVTAGNTAHGFAAWTLLALVGGHILMGLIHRFAWNDDVLSRMTGRLDNARG